jgi:hypothetical protein
MGKTNSSIRASGPTRGRAMASATLSDAVRALGTKRFRQALMIRAPLRVISSGSPGPMPMP